MIDLWPELADYEMDADELLLMGASEAALVGLAPGGLWLWDEGLYLLIRWSGARLPLPTLDCFGDGRVAEIVGTALPSEQQVEEYAGTAHAASTVYHYAVVPMSGVGTPGAIDPLAVMSRVTSGAGADVGLLPNAPAAITVQVLPGNVPLIRWRYSAAGEQAAPLYFRVYSEAGAAAFNFASPAGTVDYTSLQSQYEWRGPAMSAGDLRAWTVRAESALGVLSLLPQDGQPPAEAYSTLSKGRARTLVAETQTPGATLIALERGP